MCLSIRAGFVFSNLQYFNSGSATQIQRHQRHPPAMAAPATWLRFFEMRCGGALLQPRDPELHPVSGAVQLQHEDRRTAVHHHQPKLLW